MNKNKTKTVLRVFNLILPLELALYLLGRPVSKGPQWDILQYFLMYWAEKIWQSSYGSLPPGSVIVCLFMIFSKLSN